MKKVIFIVSAVAVLGLTSCKTKKALQECQLNNQTLTEQLQQVKNDLALANSKTTSLEEQLATARKDYTALQNALDKSLTSSSQSTVNIAKLVEQIDESNQYIRHLTELKSKSDSLNLILTTNLTRSLSKDELNDVDVKVLKGVVYVSLSDNMLFKSGSYAIRPEARETIAKIAKIITDYKDYDVLVEGNTDTVPINMKNIRNNWDLSCLRASSVVQYLQENFDVNPSRMTAGGRGEYNPVADNETAEGRQSNRRTQIIITPRLDQFMDLLEKN